MLATARSIQLAGLTPDEWQHLCEKDVWLQLVPGVWRHEATPLTWEMQVRAGLQWLGSEACLYGAAAARWLGLEGVDDAPAEFLVHRARRHLPPWMTLHTTLTWTKGDTLLLDGVRCANATRAIIDMARTHGARTLETTIDSAVRLRRTSTPTLTRRMQELEGSGRAGIRLLRTLLLDSGGESFLERRFLRLVRRSGLPRPVPQVVYHSNTGRVMRVDFEFPSSNLIVEVSGRKGHASDRDRQRDARRRNDLRGRQGKQFLEFTTADVVDDEAYVLATLLQHVHVMA